MRHGSIRGEMQHTSIVGIEMKGIKIVENKYKAETSVSHVSHIDCLFDCSPKLV